MRMTMKTKLLWGVLLGMVLMLGLFPALGMSARADRVPYVYRQWYGGSAVVSETRTVDAQPITSAAGSLNGWYVVSHDVTYPERLTVSGSANIILTDGAELKCEKGINVSYGNILNIYGQTQGTGKLTCEVHTGSDNAAIGSDDEGSDCGTVNIYGGNVKADGRAVNSVGAGIGGGDACSGGYVTIYGGTVEALGGIDGAGIGGGQGGSGGEIIIRGGTVTAWGGAFDQSLYAGAGIGGGGEKGDSGTITITGGTVTACGGDDSAGIGSGDDGRVEKIEITGGTVKAYGSEYAAGIGGGDRDELTRDGEIIIRGTANVEAHGGIDGAGIGGGEETTGGKITISENATVEAYGGSNTIAPSGGAGIGGGDNAGCGIITIKDNANVTAKGGSGAASIGAGDEGQGRGTITISGNARVTASGGTDGAGIGGGDHSAVGMITVSGGTVEADGGENGAGIGAGDGDGEQNWGVAISGGTVTAKGGENGAGIGGGNEGSADVTISGGTVTAKGGENGAGIGGGYESAYPRVRITGGVITATGNNGGRGIGFGKDGDKDGGYDIVDVARDLTVSVGNAAHESYPINTEAYIADHHYSYVHIKRLLTVTYDSNGSTGGTVPASQTYEYNSRVTVSSNTGNLVKEDHYFSGWNTKADGSGVPYNPDETFNITENITLYAQWDYEEKPVVSLELDRYAETIGVNSVVTLIATLEPNNATDKTVTWSVSNADAVKLYSDADCTVPLGTEATNTKTVYAKGAAEGVAAVTVTSNANSSMTDSCTLTVLAPVEYVNADGNTATCDTYTVVTSETTRFENGKWYVAKAYEESVNIRGRVIVDGSANLILVDGCDLSVEAGITVEGNASLTIFGQTGNTGRMTAASAPFTNFDGTTTYYPAGIGSFEADAGSITINGGIITANGNSGGDTYNPGGAGIGGGYSVTDSNYTGYSGGRVTVRRATVDANGAEASPGIGNGNYYNGSTKSTVTVYSGEVYAYGGRGGAGIDGAGFSIYGGEVYAAGGNDRNADPTSAGIGDKCTVDNIGTGLIVYAGSNPWPNDSIPNADFIKAHPQPYVDIRKGSIVPVTGVTLDPSETTIDVDKTKTLTAKIAPLNATYKTVKWSVSGTNPDAVKLYSDAACTTEIGTEATNKLTVYAKGVSVGKATVTVTADNGTPATNDDKTANCAVTITGHTHSFIYNVNGAAIQATCHNTAVHADDYVETLTIVKPTLTTFGQSGEGISEKAALEGLDAFNTATGLTVSADSILYYNATKNGDSYTRNGRALTAAPTGVGDYLAEITLSGVRTNVGENQSITAFAGYTIARADPVPATVTANNRTYDGTEKPLVIVTGEANGGEMQYSPGTDATTAPTDSWSTSTPTATDSGTYYVWYKVAGDLNHNDTTPACLTVTVSKDTPSVTTPAGLTATYGQTLADVTLPDGWEWVDSSVKPTVNNNGYAAALNVDDVNYDYSGVDGYAAGTHTVTRTVALTVSKLPVAPPTIREKPYIGSLQTADVTDTELYTVTENNGGTEIGAYDVVLTLKDTENTMWTTSGEASITLKFWIERIVVPAPDAVTYGPKQTLKDIPLNDENWGWEWVDETIVPTVANHGYKAVLREVMDEVYNLNGVEGYDPQEHTITRTIPLTVNKATVTAPSIAGKTYNGQVQTADVAQNPRYTVTKNEGGTAAGEYEVVLTLADPANYRWSDSEEAEKTLTFQILPASAGAVVTPTLNAVTYDPTKTLADLTLPGGWAWVYPATVPTVGNSGYEAALSVNDRDYDYTGVDGYNPGSHKVTRTVAMTVNKATVTAPEIASKAYNGQTQKADVAPSDLYTVTKNAGGRLVGDYVVELTLKDSANYRWTDNSRAVEILVFEITRAAAPEIVTPTMAAVTYDPTKTLANVPLPDGWVWVDSSVKPTVNKKGYAAALNVDDVNYDYSGVEGYAAKNHTVTRTVALTVNKLSVEPPIIREKPYTGSLQRADVTDTELYTVTKNEGGTDIGAYDVVLTLKDTENTMWTTSADASVTLKFWIERIVVPAPDAVTYDPDRKLKDIPLNDDNWGWKWVDLAIVPTVANNGYKAELQVDNVYNLDGVEGYDPTKHTITRTIPLTVNKATVTAPAIAGKTYNGQVQTADVARSSLYTVTKNEGGTAAGEYEVVLTLADPANYKWSDSEEAVKTLTFQIKQASAAPVVTPTLNAVTYDPTKTLADLTLPDGWAWVYPAAVPTVGNSGYEAALSVNDRDYDYTSVDGYNPGSHKVTRTVALTVNKAPVTTPAIASKAYNGQTQKADVAPSDLYTVTKNDGGTAAGKYDVELTLKDSANYRWTDSSDAAKTLVFEITKAAAPEIVTPTPDAVTYDLKKTMANVPLPDGWAWADSSVKPTVKNNGYAAVLAVDDSNYNFTGVAGYNAQTHRVTRTVALTVNKLSVEPPIIREKPYTGNVQRADVKDTDLYSVTKNDGGIAIGAYDVVLTLKDTANTMWTNSGDASVTLKFWIERIVVPEPDPVTYDPQQTLKDIPMGDDWGWEWVDPTIVPTVANNGYKAVLRDVWDDVYNLNGVEGYDSTDHTITRTIPLTVNKATVTAPAIAGKTYNGQVQTADVAESSLYTVTKNDGGTAVGGYEVVLKLVDPANYKWSDSEEAVKTLTFQIMQASAAPVVTPTLNTVTYDPEKTLENIMLPDSWEWVEKTTIPTVGNSGYEAALTVNDRDYDYSNVEGYDVQNHRILRTVALTVNKATVSAPVIESKPYNGRIQRADVEQSDLYTVTKNDGGRLVGDYDVVLTLKDSANYRWTDSSGAVRTLVFEITRAVAPEIVTPTPAAVTYNSKKTLESVPLSDGWEWVTRITVPTVGNSGYAAALTVDDSNYNYTGVEGYNAQTHRVTRTVALTVNKLPVVPPVIRNKVYTGFVQRADVKNTDLYTVTKNDGGKEIGEYPVVLTLKDAANTRWTGSEDATITLIFRIDQIVVPAPAAVTYDPNRTLADVPLGDDWGWEWVNKDIIVPTVANNGYNAVLNVMGKNYNLDGVEGYDSTTQTITRTIPLKVNKAPVTVPVIADKTYTGEKQTADVAASDFYTVTTNAGGTDVGVYDVVLMLKDSANYRWTDSEEAKKTLAFHITNAAAPVVTTPTPDAVTYDPTKTLENILLPAGWEWVEKTTVPTVDNSGYEAAHTVSDDANYDYTGVVGYNPESHKVTRTVALTVKKAPVNTPEIASKAYNGQTQKADVEDTDLYTVTKNNGGRLVGDYDVVLTLKDSVNYRWTGSNGAVKTLVFEITKATAPEIVTPPPADVTYDLKKTLSNVPLPDAWEWVNSSIRPTVNNNGYAAVQAVDDSNYDFTGVDGYNAQTHRVTRTVALTVNKLSVAPPIIRDKVYTGFAQRADVRNTDLYIVTKNDGGTEIGAYEVVLTLKDAANTRWTDSEEATKTLTLCITKAAAPVVTTPTPDAVTYDPTKTLANILLPDGWEWVEKTTVPTVDNNGYDAALAVDDTHYDYISVEGYSAENQKVTRTVTLTVSAANAVAATVTASNRTYDGTEKPLVAEDNSTLAGGTMYYARGTKDAATEEYKTSIPTGIDAGTYYVWYKAAAANPNYRDSEAGCVEARIFGPITLNVTFRVVNGLWNDGEGEAAAADRTVTLTGYEGDTLKLSADQIPAVGGRPNESFIAGSWDTTPDTETPITADVTYTYTYAKTDEEKESEAPAKPETPQTPAQPEATPKTPAIEGVTPDRPESIASTEQRILNAPNDNDLAGATHSLLQARGVPKSKKSIKLGWKRVSGATAYTIFGNRCGKGKRYLKIATVKGTSYTAGKLKDGTYYKYVVVAHNGNDVLAISKTIHVTTKGGQYTNDSKVVVNKKSLKLKVGKKAKIKTDLRSSGKVKHHRKVCFESSNRNVATVNKNGQVRAVGKGTCYIYCYAQNGIFARVKVKVK